MSVDGSTGKCNSIVEMTAFYVVVAAVDSTAVTATAAINIRFFEEDIRSCTWYKVLRMSIQLGNKARPRTTCNTFPFKGSYLRTHNACSPLCPASAIPLLVIASAVYLWVHPSTDQGFIRSIRSSLHHRINFKCLLGIFHETSIDLHAWFPL